jgi:hypothetical protein
MSPDSNRLGAASVSYPTSQLLSSTGPYALRADAVNFRRWDQDPARDVNGPELTLEYQPANRILGNSQGLRRLSDACQLICHSCSLQHKEMSCIHFYSTLQSARSQVTHEL